MSEPSDNPHESLPPEVRLTRGADGSIELTVTAADADELAWRVHDIVELIQDGRLAGAVTRLTE